MRFYRDLLRKVYGARPAGLDPRERARRVSETVGARLVEREEGIVVRREREEEAGERPILELLEYVYPEIRSWDWGHFRRIVALDTETTGLAGGVGTKVFLIGLLELDLESGLARTRQFFLPDPGMERAFLKEFRDALDEDALLLTYNGRTFDLPLIRTRYLVHGEAPPEFPYHLDLLVATRRVLRYRLPSRALSDVERDFLGKRRAVDIPSEEIPYVYQAFLRDGNTERLPEVFSHNEEDIRTLAQLLIALPPLAAGVRDDGSADFRFVRGMSLRWWGRPREALEAFRMALQGKGLEEELAVRICREAGRCARELRARALGVPFWEEWLRVRREPEPLIELAKFYEHDLQQPERALRLAEEALRLEEHPGKRREILHRIQRLRRKVRR